MNVQLKTRCEVEISLFCRRCSRMFSYTPEGVGRMAQLCPDCQRGGDA